MNLYNSEAFEQKMKQELGHLMLDLSDMFNGLRKIELIKNDNSRNKLTSNIEFLIKLSTDEIFGNGDIEIEIKDSLVIHITKEFAERFLLEELKIPKLTEDKLNKFIDKISIDFDENNSILMEPCVSFRSSSDSYLLLYLLEESNCKEVEKIKLKKFFASDTEWKKEIRGMVTNKLFFFLKDELDFIDEKLKNYVKKMAWVFELNDEYNSYIK